MTLLDFHKRCSQVEHARGSDGCSCDGLGCQDGWMADRIVGLQDGWMDGWVYGCMGATTKHTPTDTRLHRVLHLISFRLSGIFVLRTHSRTKKGQKKKRWHVGRHKNTPSQGKKMSWCPPVVRCVARVYPFQGDSPYSPFWNSRGTASYSTRKLIS